MLQHRSNLRLTGGPLDHCPNVRSKITSLRWSIGPSSNWTVKFRKFGRSKLRHLDQGAFLPLITDPPPTSPNSLSPFKKNPKKRRKSDTWHLTRKTWHMTHDMWHVTCYTWHKTLDMWHVAREMWHVTCRSKKYEKYGISIFYFLGPSPRLENNNKLNYSSISLP